MFEVARGRAQLPESFKTFGKFEVRGYVLSFCSPALLCVPHQQTCALEYQIDRYCLCHELDKKPAGDCCLIFFSCSWIIFC